METIDFILVTEGEMDFGLLVADYNAQLGSYGFIIKLNIKNKLPQSAVWVIGENADGEKSAVFDEESTLQELLEYMESETCPDLAFNLSGNILSIFFKNGTYGIRFSYEIKRHAINMTTEDSKLDIPEDLFTMYKDVCYKIAGEADRSIDQRIYEEEKRIIG